MFTGIIQDIGEITALDKTGDWKITITTRMLLADLVLGASIACNGICVTVIDKGANHFHAQLSTETLDKTTAKHWHVGQRVNLERALRAGDELGGHYVSGHIDGVARVVGKQGDADSLRLRFEVPKEFAKFIAPKGSIAIDGVSLTVNEVENTIFGVNIIPHTQAMTMLASLHIGDSINFEIDTIARYVDRMMQHRVLIT
jgi:riboflavin synthase